MLRCSVARGKNSSSVLPLIIVHARAGLEDDAGDGGLALAGRAVARVGGEVDRRAGDRLLRLLLGSGLGGSLLVLRSRGPRAARRPRATMSTSRSAPGMAGLTRGVSSSSSPSASASASGSASASAAGSARPRPLRRARSASASRRRLGRGCGRLLGVACGLGGGALGSLLLVARGLVLGRRRLVGHVLSISIGCGCCAAWGWSGPA